MKKTNVRWVIQIVITSLVISMVFTFASAELLGNAGKAMAFVVLAVFIALGVVFDILGVATASASPVPFHSMASHRERGATEALWLLKNAEKVSSICNDVVGDISGIVSGATAAAIAAGLMRDLSTDNVIIQLLISGLVAALTIGGKAVGKTYALNNSTAIVLRAGKLLNLKTRLFHKR